MRTLSLAIAMAAAAGTGTPPPMANHAAVSNGWFRALPRNLPAGGYFDLENTGRWMIRLTGAASPACGMLLLHKSEETGGVGRMEDVGEVDIPAHGTIRFTPGGYHLMCMDPTAAMKPASSVPVTLKFSDTTTATATFVVRNARGQ